MTKDKTMLLLETKIVDNCTLYRTIFRFLGLDTVEAAAHVFRTVHSNIRRERQKPDSDPLTWGFDVEALHEGEEPADDLGLGKFIIGNKDIAFYDADGYNVWVAEREETDLVLVYNARGLFLDLLDEQKTRISAALVPKAGTSTTKGAAMTQTVTTLALVLGYGYIVTPGPGVLSVHRRGGQTIVLDIERTVGLLSALVQDKGALSDSRTVFEVLKRAEIKRVTTDNEA